MLSKQCVRFVRLTTVAVLLPLLASAAAAAASAGQATSSSSPRASSGTAKLPCDPAADFNATDFSNPTTIDNEWLPLVPGTQLILAGLANRGGGLLPHRVVFTVTDLTKVINGVRTVVIWDADLSAGQLVETELAFFAQDDEGNVWNLGEYPEEYEDGEFVGAPSTWIAGLGAEAGVHMLAEPRQGTGYYLQGWAPAIGFLDCAKVFKTGEGTCVPVNCYENVLVTDEKSPLEGGGHQRKYHARGVGIVQVGAVGDPEGETLVLVEIVHLNQGALVQARKEALKLDERAYEVSDVYAKTPPAERA